MDTTPTTTSVVLFGSTDVACWHWAIHTVRIQKLLFLIDRKHRPTRTDGPTLPVRTLPLAARSTKDVYRDAYDARTVAAT